MLSYCIIGCRNKDSRGKASGGGGGWEVKSIVFVITATPEEK